VLPHLVDLAIKICGGVSGGISLYEENPAPGILRWHYLRGDLQKFTGCTTRVTSVPAASPSISEPRCSPSTRSGSIRG
jgi:hypothetical protein